MQMWLLSKVASASQSHLGPKPRTACNAYQSQGMWQKQLNIFTAYHKVMQVHSKQCNDN